MLTARGDFASDTSRKKTIVAEVATGTRKVSFEGIEEWKRFLRTHPVIVAAKRDGVLVHRSRDTVHNFIARLPVEFRIAPVHAGSEDIGEFQVRLGRN